MTTTEIPDFHLHKEDFANLFRSEREAARAVRIYAEPFARRVLGDNYVDNANGWLGWDVAPVYKNGELAALDFTSIILDDRGPGTRNTTRVDFYAKPVVETLGINPSALRVARGLCEGSGYPSEYVRACAEMLIDMTPGLTMDEHKDALIEWLGA